jgi:hypothetical protein
MVYKTEMKKGPSTISPHEWDALLDSIPLTKVVRESDLLSDDMDEEMLDDDFFDHEISDNDIDEQNENLLRRQKIFRIAARFVADEFRKFAWVTQVAIIGSVAKPLCKEVPRFRDYRRRGIELWHECSDLDLAVWVGELSMLNDLRKARTAALKSMHEKYPNIMGVAHHQAEIFVIDASTDAYLGRLCTFGQCPKQDKRECKTLDCGKTPFLKRMEGFRFYPDALIGSVPLYLQNNNRNE